MSDKLVNKELTRQPHDAEDDIFMCPAFGKCEDDSKQQCSDGICHGFLAKCPGGSLNCLTPQDCNDWHVCHATDADEAVCTS